MIYILIITTQKMIYRATRKVNWFKSRGWNSLLKGTWFLWPDMECWAVVVIPIAKSCPSCQLKTLTYFNNPDITMSCHELINFTKFRPVFHIQIKKKNWWLRIDWTQIIKNPQYIIFGLCWASSFWFSQKPKLDLQTLRQYELTTPFQNLKSTTKDYHYPKSQFQLTVL